MSEKAVHEFVTFLTPICSLHLRQKYTVDEQKHNMLSMYFSSWFCIANLLCDYKLGVLVE